MSTFATLFASKTSSPGVTEHDFAPRLLSEYAFPASLLFHSRSRTLSSRMGTLVLYNRIPELCCEMAEEHTCDRKDQPIVPSPESGEGRAHEPDTQETNGIRSGSAEHARRQLGPPNGKPRIENGFT